MIETSGRAHLDLPKVAFISRKFIQETERIETPGRAHSALPKVALIRVWMIFVHSFIVFGCAFGLPPVSKLILSNPLHGMNVKLVQPTLNLFMKVYVNLFTEQV